MQQQDGGIRRALWVEASVPVARHAQGVKLPFLVQTGTGEDREHYDLAAVGLDKGGLIGRIKVHAVGKPRAEKHTAVPSYSGSPGSFSTGVPTVVPIDVAWG